MDNKHMNSTKQKDLPICNCQQNYQGHPQRQNPYRHCQQSPSTTPHRHCQQPWQPSHCFVLMLYKDPKQVFVPDFSIDRNVVSAGLRARKKHQPTCRPELRARTTTERNLVFQNLDFGNATLQSTNSIV